MRVWRDRLYNDFGALDCTITRAQAKEAAAYITALSFFLTLAKLDRMGLPLDPGTPIWSLVHVQPAFV